MSPLSIGISLWWRRRQAGAAPGAGGVTFFGPDYFGQGEYFGEYWGIDP